jgi:hypothetical protein
LGKAKRAEGERAKPMTSEEPGDDELAQGKNAHFSLELCLKISGKMRILHNRHYIFITRTFRIRIISMENPVLCVF